LFDVSAIEKAVKDTVFYYIDEMGFDKYLNTV